MSAQTTITLLRIVHIIAGIFWAGSVFLIAGFLFPTIKETGLDGGRVMEHLMVRRKLAAFMTASAILAILAGIGLYWRSAAGTNGAWQGSHAGIAYGIGGACAILAAIVGAGMIQPTAKRLMALGQQVSSTGVPPEPGSAVQMQLLQGRLGVLTRVVAALLLVTILTMATARYL